ncbi:MAG: 6-pyruvoyl tetrahydrobiopterin synthase, partial [Thermogutta sp.]|nr:6-pyruvoyl tetrahydrobiopterin synthase [Thermogutta sp.]
EVAGLDDRGMVVDFSDIKRVISQWIDDHLDHRMILCRRDPAVPLLQGLGEPLFLMDENPTAENIARVIFEFAAGQGLPIVQTALYETPRCVAVYRPSERS